MTLVRPTVESLAAAPLLCAALAAPALAQDDPESSGRAIERRTQEIRDAASPAIVSVTAIPRANPLPRLAFPGLLVAPCPRSAERVEGTGFFVASRGLLVTTRELVAEAERIEVRFVDGTVRDASVVGIDLPYRVAVLKTSAPTAVTALPHLDRVEATGSTVGWFLGAAPTLSSSVATPSIDVQVASVRPAPAQGAYDRFLYAPISLQRGAAGGPLVGCDGRLLGMAVGSLVAKEDAAESGLRTRLPRATLFVRGDDVAEAARQIAANGFVERPMIGTLMDGDTNRVEVLLPGGPAEKAGFADGDLIVAVGSVAIASHQDLARALLRRRSGDEVRVTLERDGKRLVKHVVLAPFRAPDTPTRPPFPGAVLELSCAGAEETESKGADVVFTFIEVAGDSAVAKGGVVAGDRLVAVDGRAPRHFLQRHRVRPDASPPKRISVEHEGQVRELEIPQ
jgi:serine protease Do